MTERILAAIARRYPLTERDAGEFAETSVNGMCVKVRCFDAEGLGNVSLMQSGVSGVMEMDTVIINPFVRDMPLFSFDRVFAGGKDTRFLELYDTKLSHTPNTEGLEKLIEANATLEDVPLKPNWYDDILYPESVVKVATAQMSAQLDALTEAYLEEYLRLCDTAPECARDEKIRAAARYTEGLLTHGGPSTDVFVKAKGKEFTERLFRSALFGTGTPEKGQEA